MSGKLKDYQVLDVLCGGTFYKVRHKVTNNIFAWKAYNCSSYKDEEVKCIVDDVHSISKVISDNLLRYYDSIQHTPSRTLYFVLEYNSWRSLEELVASCRSEDSYIAESFIWYLLHELANVCKVVEPLKLAFLQKCITTKSIFVDESGELRVNCFEMVSENNDLIRQVGEVIHSLCYSTGCKEKIKPFLYSDDLQDVVSFMVDDKNTNTRPDVILYHPTVLANLETLAGPKNLSEIIVPIDSFGKTDVNKCDSEKAVELCKSVEPVCDSPIYINVSPRAIEAPKHSPKVSLSPTIAALALELPGFVPRSRRPITDLESYNSPKRVTEKTLSQQWMSRLVALRHREESLNKRERDLIAKEIVNSPNTKIIPLRDDEDNEEVGVNGITLPPITAHLKNEEKPVFRRRRSSSVKTRRNRKTYAYEDLDSSLSADQGDESIIVTGRKITKDNLPRRAIFPDSKKVHFTSVNPFVESDESVTLTFYELDDKMNKPTQNQVKDIQQFKYLDLEKVTSEKRAAMQQWNHSSPNKQPKINNKKAFKDITNVKDGLQRTPSKTSLLSKMSNTSASSQYSTSSMRSTASTLSKVSESISNRTRSSVRMSLAPDFPKTEVKKPKGRMSLLPFKTPFKFMSKS